MRKRLAGGNAKPLGHPLHFCLEPVLFPSFRCQIAKSFASSSGSYASCKLSFTVQ